MTISEQGDGQGKSRADDQPMSKSGGSGALPSFMYVHYLRESETEPFPVYLFQLGDAPDLPTEIKDATKAIRAGDATEVKPGSYGKVEWRVFSYVVFVLDYARSEITKVVFNHKNTNYDRSFDWAGNVPRYETSCTAVYYKNKRKNVNNNALGPNEKDIIEWEAIHSRPIVNAAGGIVNHQSSDPNTGP